MTAIKLGVTLPQFTKDRERFLDGVARAEAAGLDSVWLFDHLWPLSGGKERAILEGWTALAYVAARTTNIGVGTLVTRSTLRRPALLGKMAATVAALAPGRTTIGVGSGDHMSRRENEEFGYEYFAADQRFAQFASTVRALRSYLHEDVVAQTDDFISLTGLPTSPRPTPPPLWIAGRSTPMLEIAGRYGDGWNGWGGTPESFARDAALVRDAAGVRRVELTWAGLAVMGRDDGDARSRLGGRDPSDYLVGGPATIAARLNEFVAAGATHLVLTLTDPGRPAMYEMLGAEVKPALDSSAR